MYDCSKMITAFHNQRVRLSEKIQETLRVSRDANETRVKNGLAKASKPSPAFFVIQGSYDMETIIQQAENDYDIDDGIVFAGSDLKRPKGGDMSSLEARQMVCSALQSDQFATQPEVRKNCVRVYYQEGYHVDMPVYRQVSDWLGNTFLEIASADWKRSDPKAVSKWFLSAVKDKSPDETNGRQMRRITRLLKAFCRSRKSWCMPSGLIISVLVNDSYYAWDGRDDISFLRTITAISSRLQSSLRVQHPVVAEYLSKGDADPRLVELRDKLVEAVDALEILYDPSCTEKAAVSSWKKVFGSDFFDEFLASKSRSLSALASSVPVEAVDKMGGGRFG